MRETEPKQTGDIQRIIELTDTLALQRKINLDHRWQDLRRKITHMRRRQRTLYFLRNAAAILLIPVLIAGLLYVKALQSEIQNQATSVGQIAVTAACGQISKIILPDLSEVWLNAGSTLTYPQRFADGRRAVRLSGEAYFAVKADANNRFDVLTDDSLTVSAHGTEFNISAYSNDSALKVTLAEGHIEVGAPNLPNPVVLRPGQQFACSRAGRAVACTDINLYVETAWREGKLVFRRTRMTEIVKRLSRRFNADIELKDKELYDYEYSATFTTESLRDILSLLEKSAPVRCRIVEPMRDQDFAYSKRTVTIQMKK
jgi:ferric-dicitrate binding protein FerR (iron transport regulator)